MPKHTLTDKFCAALPFPESGQRIYFDDHKDAPVGFGLRVTKGSKSWVMQYVADRVQRRLTLPVGFPEWGPKIARAEAAKLRVEVQTGADPLEARRAEKRQREEAKDQRARMAELTLGALCSAYCDHLEAGGKTSARAVRAALQRHVVDAVPKLARKVAAEVTIDDALEIMDTLADSGRKREAAKVRSYLRAAFAAAINARRAPGALPALRAIGRTLTANPLREVGPVAGSNKARDRALSIEEARAYWRHIKGMAGPVGALLQFHLLSGGQRVQQLARATVDDIEDDALLLLDPKGRRKEPRKHWVPLLPEARAALEVMRGRGRGPFVFTLSEGKRAANPTTVSHTLQSLSAELVESGEVSATFTAGDIRRTVETLLAGRGGVSTETRAQLQSHGLHGVQSRHYNRHDYSEEKRDALQRLLAFIEGKPATVTPIRRAAR